MDSQEVEITTQENKTEELVKLKGRFLETVGRRKTAIARVRLFKKGAGVIMVNEGRLSDYFSQNYASIIKQPLKLTSHLRDLNFSVLVKGGGKKGQAEAVRHGIARSLVEMDEALKVVIKTKGWLTRDSRKKERKKPGLKKARRAPQWAKR